jgi:hypothetical protein
MDRNPVIGFALPPFVFSGKSVVIIDRGRIEVDGFDASSRQYPLSFSAEGIKDFTFPIDPIMSVSLKNVITRRQVSKGKQRGSIKERWTEDDADISISGVFIDKDGYYPAEVEQLRAFMGKQITVLNTFLNEKDINQIVIESIDFPHTKGIENQTFEIKAYSDDVFQLLIES